MNSTVSWPETIPEAARQAAERWPHDLAMIDGDRRWTFPELWRDARLAAAALIATGTQRGDTVAIWTPNSARWVLAALGAHIAGARIVPMNTRLKGVEAGDILRRSHSNRLLTTCDFLGSDYRTLLADEELPQLRRMDVVEDWDVFVAAAVDTAAVDDRLRQLRPEDISDVLYTSGTTGFPRGVLTAHHQVTAMFGRWANRVGLQHGDRYLIVNPMFHVFGYKAGWVAALLLGATILPMATFDVPEVIRRIGEDRISFLPGPPTIFQSLLAENARGGGDFASLRVAVTGAAPVPPIMVERLRRELGLTNVVNGYGMTEHGAITMTCQGDDAETVAHTCGCALPDVEIRCVDDNGRDLPAGEAGEFWVRSPFVMKGYLDDPVATAATIDAEGWLHTGDVGTLDDNGYLRITDRKKDMYISGGFNCYPAEIEKLLCAHPAIEVAAVVGVPEERMGEVGKAFVVLRPGAQVSPDEIRAWARDAMANYKIPRMVVIVDDLPRNAAGKILRRELRETAQEVPAG